MDSIRSSRNGLRNCWTSSSKSPAWPKAPCPNFPHWPCSTTTRAARLNGYSDLLRRHRLRWSRVLRELPQIFRARPDGVFGDARHFHSSPARRGNAVCGDPRRTHIPVAESLRRDVADRHVDLETDQG